MVQSPSWEANWFTASQEIPRISRNPNVHYRTHKRPPPVSILGQPNPVHIPTSWRSVLILSTHLRLGLPSGLFPSGFPTKTLHTPLSSPIRATCPAYLILYGIMDILMSETCWAHTWNKIASDIKLVFYSSTITMMHGPINIRLYITIYKQIFLIIMYLNWSPRSVCEGLHK